MGSVIVLPFPPAKLSGHNTGHWGGKSGDIAALRLVAKRKTREAAPEIPEKGDINIHFRFVPPNRRGDRVNFPNRIKPLIDGIADGLDVNDARFLPSYEFAEPAKPGWVEVTL
ncbi:hypothetical protein [Parasphingopyxis sp.]|uniref:hypothetical protein n=1 Tax=Parasphingopyxis sp. TaxID=1920299 RepID=UPI0026322B87|nr:hypothetical protein [Parasphingopyxis sp.]